jgi:hypothetical protein
VAASGPGHPVDVERGVAGRADVDGERREDVVEVRLITAAGVTKFPTAALPDLLQRDEGLIWVDIPLPDKEAGRVLADVFGFHPLAVKDSLERNRVPKAHGYADHVFFILHKPERGERGTTSSWTSSSAAATWSPCTARSTRTSTPPSRCGRPARSRPDSKRAG